MIHGPHRVWGADHEEQQSAARYAGVVRFGTEFMSLRFFFEDPENAPSQSMANVLCRRDGSRKEGKGREDYSLRLNRTPAARSPASAPNTGAGAWVKVGTGVPSSGAAVVAAGVFCTPEVGRVSPDVS